MIIRATWENFETDRGPGTSIKIPAMNFRTGTDHLATEAEVCELAADYCEAVAYCQTGRRISVSAHVSGEYEITLDCSSCVNEMVAALLYRLRLCSGMSQRATARDEGVSHSGVALYESGKRSPGVQKLDSLLSALGYDMEIVVRPKVA